MSCAVPPVERILDRRQVHPVTVSGELNSAGDAVNNVLHELGGGATVKRSTSHDRQS
jgi:hypothetical protein